MFNVLQWQSHLGNLDVTQVRVKIKSAYILILVIIALSRRGSFLSLLYLRAYVRRERKEGSKWRKVLQNSCARDTRFPCFPFFFFFQKIKLQRNSERLGLTYQLSHMLIFTESRQCFLNPLLASTIRRCSLK